MGEVIAVLSGKGGTGKSSLCAGIAQALAQMLLKAGTRVKIIEQKADRARMLAEMAATEGLRLVAEDGEYTEPKPGEDSKNDHPSDPEGNPDEQSQDDIGDGGEGGGDDDGGTGDDDGGTGDDDGEGNPEGKCKGGKKKAAKKGKKAKKPRGEGEDDGGDEAVEIALGHKRRYQHRQHKYKRHMCV